MAKVSVLIVRQDEDHDPEVYACAAMARARERLDEYMQAEWGETPGDPTLMTREQRIAAYFEYYERAEYEIGEYEVLE